MSTEFNELLSVSSADKPQNWIVGTREQITHLMNEMTVRGMVRDRSHFSPIIPAPFVAGKYMVVLVQ